MNEHTGFHEYKEGKRFNPECLTCLAEDRDYKQYLLLVALRNIVILRDFIVSEVIDPDGEAAKDWRDTFSLIPKSTIAFLKNLRG